MELMHINSWVLHRKKQNKTTTKNLLTVVLHALCWCKLMAITNVYEKNIRRFLSMALKLQKFK